MNWVIDWKGQASLFRTGFTLWLAENKPNDVPTDWTYSPLPGLTEALTWTQSLYILLYFLMNA